jgi:endonuclease/exonuclease/phosphatase family metal-dependent hydrolase
MRLRPLLPTLALVSALAVLASLSTATAAGRPPGRPYAHLQMNLCLSGIAGCFAGTRYPKVVDEAVATIQRVDPASVTIAEACSGDAAAIAERTGMYVSFADVESFGSALPCRNPDGRGEFGNAVLTRSAPVLVESRPFESQVGQEQRRWICVTGQDRVTVCGAHLAVGAGTGTLGQAGQDAQCAEFGEVLQARAADHAVIASGDMNRQSSCAPAGFWTLRDDDATQDIGIQHVYGEANAFARPSRDYVRARYTDHDYLSATATLRSGL